MNSGMLFKLKNFTVICNYDDIINRLKKKRLIINFWKNENPHNKVIFDLFYINLLFKICFRRMIMKYKFFLNISINLRIDLILLLDTFY